MTAAERQQRKRDRIKAGLVLIQEWVPADKADAVRDAVAAALADCHVSKTQGDWKE